ncbi:MAG: tRNA uridine-5-carboxymethylaminomethyl(34) synthesis GTPase MnmE, partial [Planctomycetes bacterium]|nr:tRNA uridine-5-carboxymethylaminomethyl(34) synthesis GTPase MnmE [Planctomycetota bacterium]
MVDPRAPEPIAAVGTPFGSGPVGVVRVSGKGCIEIVERWLAVPSMEARRPVLVRIPVGRTTAPGCAVALRAPASYTGEDC